MNILKDAGFLVTMNETEMNVFVEIMSNTGPVTPTTPDGSGSLDYLPIVIGGAALVLVAVIVIAFKRQSTTRKMI